MKKNILIVLMILASFMASSQTKVLLNVGANSMTASLADNEATRELIKLLEKGAITIDMNDYGGFEKVGALPESLPSSNTQITTVPGDIMLYQGNNIVIFYGSNSWSYTRIGKIDGATVSNLKQFLGSGSLSLTLSLAPVSGIRDIAAEGNNKADIIYDLNGNKITGKPLSPGIYIINGRKTLIKG